MSGRFHSAPLLAERSSTGSAREAWKTLSAAERSLGVRDGILAQGVQDHRRALELTRRKYEVGSASLFVAVTYTLAPLPATPMTPTPTFRQ